jgi:hypothetical protein
VDERRHWISLEGAETQHYFAAKLCEPLVFETFERGAIPFSHEPFAVCSGHFPEGARLESGENSTGTGIGGGTLLTGWKGALFKEWTFSSQIAAGSGQPETPVYLAAVQGTGVTGTIRPDYIGGFSRSLSSYEAPLPGKWGSAGRDSITGPAQFSLNASVGRTFRVSDRLNLDLRVDAADALNHVAFTSWNTIVNSTQFGSPAAANAMRSMHGMGCPPASGTQRERCL